MNNYVRTLANRFAALSPSVQASWQTAANSFPWLGYCLDNIYDFPEGGFVAQTGISVYNVVNCANLDLGLPVLDVAPTVATGPDNDFLFLTTEPDGLYVTWNSRSVDPVGSFYADVRIWIGNNLPGSGPAISKFTYFETIPILYNTPTLLFLFPVIPPAPSMEFAVYGVTIGEVGAGPFAAERLVE